MANNLQSYGTVAVAGNNSATATLLTYHVNILTGADNVKGVKLPLLNPDLDEIHIFNNSADSAAAIYLNSSNTFLGFSDPFVLSGNQYAQFKRLSISQWGVSDPGYRGAPQFANAAGSVQGDAVALNLGASHWIVYAADGTRGARLPVFVDASLGIIRYLFNGENAILKVYPATDNYIYPNAANASISVPAYAGVVFLAAVVPQWYTIKGT